MLPKSTSIHINPKFGKIHINPSFLNKLNAENATQKPIPTQIYVNPKFLNRNNANNAHEERVPEPLADTSMPCRSKIISRNCMKNVSATIQPKPVNTKPLVRIGSRKLIRIGSENKMTKKMPPKIRKPIQTKYKIVKEQTAYKIDRRTLKAQQANIAKKLLKSPSKWINESLLAIKVNSR